MGLNTIQTSKIEILDNEGDVAKTISLSGGEVCIDGLAIDTGGVSPTEIVLANNHILVGQGTGLAGDVAMSGDVSIVANGTTTVANASVIAKVLTGYVSGSGTVSASDTILQAIQKLNGNDALKLPLAGGVMSGNVDMSNATALRLFELTANGTDKITVKAPDDLSNTSWTLTLPANDGDSGQVLQTNGSGVTTWATPASSAFCALLTFTPNTTGGAVTSATFVDVGGMVNQSVTIPSNGDYLITLQSLAYGGTAAYTGGEYGVSIAGAAATTLSPQMIYFLNLHSACTSSVKATLTAGSTTFKPQWRKVSGSDLNTDTSLVWKMTITGPVT